MSNFTLADNYYSETELKKTNENEKQISDTNLLLPVSTCTDCRLVSYEIQATNGCYTWDISHPDMINMKPKQDTVSKFGNDCVDAVLLTPAIQYESKTLVWITATDKNSGQVLRCKAKVGRIEKLAINSHYKQFDVGDIQHLHVVGFDDDDNIFDSLDGLRFDWQIVSGQDIIKKTTVPEASIKLRHLTDTFFVKGTKSGQARVQVKILEQGYEHVSDVEIFITVVDPFVIRPSSRVYILPTSEFSFSLAYIRMFDNKVSYDPISIPHPQYQWSVDNQMIGYISDDGLFESRVTEGPANIQVVDQKMINNTAEGFISVVFPYKLEVNITDVTDKESVFADLGSNMMSFKTLLGQNDQKDEHDILTKTPDSHILIEEHYYFIQMTLFDKDSHFITLTENLLFDTLQLDSAYIEIIKINKIGSEMIFKTKTIPRDQVKLHSLHKLSQIKTRQPEKFERLDIIHRLTVEKELLITKPVQIMHPTDFILLPFLPNHNIEEGQQAPGDVWTTYATGGSGVYSWSITNPEIASVKGSATIRSLQIGATQLVVRDHRNHKNWASINVEVAHVNQLTWIEEQMEVQSASSDGITNISGETKVMNVIALDSLGRKFTNCTAIRPTYTIKGENTIELKQDPFKFKSKYQTVREYVHDPVNRDLINLRQKFDENRNIVLGTELPHGKPDLHEILMTYHNFGICAQVDVTGLKEGLSRVKAVIQVQDYINGPLHNLESEFSEVAVYNKLTIVGPSYKPYLSDLYSKSQLGQEFQSFDSFYVDGIFSLQFGNEFVWSVIGGTNFWSDYANKYQTEFNVINIETDNPNQEILQVSKAVELTTEFHVKVRCVDPSESRLHTNNHVLLKMNQSSKQTRHLLRPAFHEAQAEIHCDAPNNTRLLWAQQYRDTDYSAHHKSSMDLGKTFQHPVVALPRSRVVQNERTHYVLVNSRHHVRYLLLDDRQLVSLNHSSIHAKVESSDENLATVLLQRGSEVASYIEDIENGFYDKRHVIFKNITGTVYLKLTLDSYYSDILRRSQNHEDQEKSIFSLFSKGKKEAFTAEGDYATIQGGYTLPLRKYADPNTRVLHDRMRIEVVRNVDVEPKYKSLYIGSAAMQIPQPYKFKIYQGSGHFSVSLNDTSLASLVHKDREILIYPTAVGGLEVRIEDLEVPEAEIAIAEVLISDISKLTIWSSTTLMEEGDQISLLVSAFDSKGIEFDDDQYQYMNFEIETEKTGVMKQQGLQTQLNETDKNNKRDFIAHGKIPGIYQLTAQTLKYQYLKQIKLGQQLPVGSANRITIVSEMLKIEVYPLLEFLPNNLLITPEMRYTLQIVGGPQRAFQAQQQDGSHIEIKLSIDNEDIATVDSFREVTGHRVGDAVLKYEIIQLRSSHHQTSPKGLYDVLQTQPASRVVSKKTIPIRVRLVTDIEIPLTNNRQIFTSSVVKLQAALKYHNEYFNHGIAPISYDWKSQNPEILNLNYPSKQDLGLAAQLVFSNKIVRNNLERNNAAQFYSQFNSSTIYATANKEGDVHVNVKLAIEYPNEYANEKNWFDTSTNIKVAEKLKIDVPEYSRPEYQQTSLYLVPPNTKAHIQTNRQTRLKLAYSEQSIYDYSTQSYSLQETKSPIISLENNDSIKTFDKYGKVTVIVEEGDSFSDQLVMLNVLISDIYSISTVGAYDALNLPLGSKMNIPIHFLNEHAHRFAKDIEGINVGIVLSHPRVVSAHLDRYNQTLTLTSLGSGECNVVLYLEDHPHIFDLIRVKVSSMVKPLSPVYLHLGGQVDFKIFDQSFDSQNNMQLNWASSNPSVLQINQQTGKSQGLSEGTAEIQLSNHAHAASIVHVNKISYGQIEHGGSLIINTDSALSGNSDELRVKVNLYLPKQGHGEEVMPTVQYDGITLIRQNVNIKCESDQPNYVFAYGEVSDLEGFFCVVRYVGQQDSKGMPRYVKVFVTASSVSESGMTIYQNKVADFEVQLTSSIKVETQFRNGIKLNKAKRTANVRIFSSNDFSVQVDYGSPEDGQLIKHQVTRSDPNSNEYNLTVTVPNQVSHTFNANLILSHPYAKQKTILNLNFDAEDSSTPIYNLIHSESIQQVPHTTVFDEGKEQGASFLSYFLVFVAFVVIVLMVMINVCEVNPLDLIQRRSGNQHARYPSKVSSYGGSGIREPRGVRRPVGYSRDSTFLSSNFNQSQNDSIYRRNRPEVMYRHSPQAHVNLDRVDYSGRRDNVNQSIYSNLDEYRRY